MRLWVLVDIEHGANNWTPVREIFTDVESAMMVLAGEAATVGDADSGATYAEHDGTYGVTYPHAQMRIQEVEV